MRYLIYLLPIFVYCSKNERIYRMNSNHQRQSFSQNNKRNKKRSNWKKKKKEKRNKGKYE